MTRLLLFLGFTIVGTAVLLFLAGGWAGRPQEASDADLPVSTLVPGTRPSIETPDGQLDIESASNITQMAPPTRIVWKDPLSDDTITIDDFQPWRCTASKVTPLPIAASGTQGARLHDIVVELYREPETHAEAIALRDGTGDDRYAALLHQRFRAGEARVTGSLGEAFASRSSDPTVDRSLGDTAFELTDHLVLEDHGQGLVIHGQEGATLTVYPDQDRAVGTGPFTLDHDAVRMTGLGLVLDRHRERGYIRVEVKRNPRLRIERASKEAGNRPILDFGEGDFQPTTVTSEGRAVLEREIRRRETVLSVQFHDQVYAAQLGGRTLNAGRASLVAFRITTPGTATDGWKLRRFHADRHVTIHYPGRTKDDERYLATIDAERLRYDVPEDGTEPTTVLEEDVDIRMRGQIAVLGPEGLLRATCRDRAWIGPLPAGAPDGGLDRALLRQIALRGDAVIERITVAEVSTEDRLGADAIDLIVWPRDKATAGAPPADAATDPADGAANRMTAVHFAAVGTVQIESPQLVGDTRRIVADDLHTTTPRVFAEGEGTRFTFRRLARGQGLLGPATKEGDDTAGPTAATAEPEGRWMLDRVVARGAVDIDTTLGGPALGIPAHLEGHEITYDGLSRLARVRSQGGRPVRIGWTASATQTNQIETNVLTLDRAAGRLTAEGGVVGELYVTPGGGMSAFGPAGAQAGFGPRLDESELTVRTDHRIDLTITRMDGRAEPVPGVKQWIRIQGPVVTELRASSRRVDRMRSETLEVALSFRTPDPETDRDTSVPTARAAREPRPEREIRHAPPQAPLERVDVKAGDVRVDLVEGEPRYLVADGGVDLSARDGHVSGARLTYDGARRRIEVHAGAMPARAILGRAGQQSEVQAERMVVDVQGGKVVRLEAHAPAGQTSDINLYRDVPEKPGAVEWFALTYQDHVVMNDARLLTQRVRLVRRVRDAGAAVFGEAVVLRAPRIIVSGRRMLATDETERLVSTIEALESGTGPGSEVNLVYGEGSDRVEMWGHLFVVDVPSQRARLEGKPGRDLKIRRGANLTMDQQRIDLDLTTNLPTFIPGSRIHWKPGR